MSNKISKEIAGVVFTNKAMLESIKDNMYNGMLGHQREVFSDIIDRYLVNTGLDIKKETTLIKNVLKLSRYDWRGVDGTLDDIKRAFTIFSKIKDEISSYRLLTKCVIAETKDGEKFCHPNCEIYVIFITIGESRYILHNKVIFGLEKATEVLDTLKCLSAEMGTIYTYELQPLTPSYDVSGLLSEPEKEIYTKLFKEQE